MTHEQVAAWLERYVEAWLTYDREQIADLFSEDAVCRYHPYDQPIEGRDAVVESWFGEGGHEGAPDRDAPGTYEASYRPVAVDGDVAVATGISRFDQPGGEERNVYYNCFLMRFDDDGRCAEFTEYFMLEPDA
jgi:ketosteroid isomerase-like protein